MRTAANQFSSEKFCLLHQVQIGFNLTKLIGAAVNHPDEIGAYVTGGILKGPQGVHASGIKDIFIAKAHGYGDAFAGKGVLL